MLEMLSQSCEYGLPVIPVRFQTTLNTVLTALHALRNYHLARKNTNVYLRRDEVVVVFRLNHLDLSLSAQNYWGSESVVDCGFLSIPQIVRVQGPGFTWSEGGRFVICLPVLSIRRGAHSGFLFCGN